MKRSFIAMLCVLCSYQLYAQRNIDFTPLNNYFVKNTYKLAPGINCMFISNKAQFEKTFGIAVTMQNDTLAPHFWREYVLAVAISPTYYNMTVSIDRAELNGHILNVYCSTTKGGKNTYVSVPLSLVVIERNKNIKTIRFYKGNIILMTLGVV